MPAKEAGSPAPEDWTACDSLNDCLLGASDCCPGDSDSDQPDQPDLVGIGRAHLQAFKAQACVNVPPCASTGMPLRNVAALCLSGHCKAVFVPEEPELSACQSNNDCILRFGLSCCQGEEMGVPLGGKVCLVAVNASAFDELRVPCQSRACDPKGLPYSEGNTFSFIATTYAAECRNGRCFATRPSP